MKKVIIIAIIFALCALCSCSTISTETAKAETDFVMTIDKVDYVVDSTPEYSYQTIVNTVTGNIIVRANDAASFRQKVRAVMNQDKALRNGGRVEIRYGEIING